MNHVPVKIDWTIRFYDVVIIIGAVIIALANFFSTKADIRNLQTLQESYHQEFLTAEGVRDKLDVIQQQNTKEALVRIEDEIKNSNRELAATLGNMNHNGENIPRKTTRVEPPIRTQEEAFNRHPGN